MGNKMNLEYVSSEYSQTYFVRGHVDLGEAIEALHDETHDADEFDPPKHTYFRVRPDNTGEFDCWYYEVDGPGRGAFPVTMMMMPW